MKRFNQTLAAILSVLMLMGVMIAPVSAAEVAPGEALDYMDVIDEVATEDAAEEEQEAPEVAEEDPQEEVEEEPAEEEGKAAKAQARAAMPDPTFGDSTKSISFDAATNKLKINASAHANLEYSANGSSFTAVTAAQKSAGIAFAPGSAEKKAHFRVKATAEGDTDSGTLVIAMPAKQTTDLKTDITFDYSAETFTFASTSYEYMTKSATADFPTTWTPATASPVSLKDVTGLKYRKVGSSSGSLLLYTVTAASATATAKLPARNGKKTLTYDKTNDVLKGLNSNVAMEYAIGGSDGTLGASPTWLKLDHTKSYATQIGTSVNYTVDPLTLPTAVNDGTPNVAGKTLYFRAAATPTASTPKMASLVSNALYIPAEVKTTDKLYTDMVAAVKFDYTKEVLQGVDTTMQYRINTASVASDKVTDNKDKNNKAKWLNGKKDGADIPFTTWITQYGEGSADLKIDIRVKAVTTGATPTRASAIYTFTIGKRPAAPAVTFNYEKDLLKDTSADIAEADLKTKYQYSANNKKWVEPKYTDILKKIPAYNKAGKENSIYIRAVAKAATSITTGVPNGVLASMGAEIKLKNRQETPKLSLAVADGGKDIALVVLNDDYKALAIASNFEARKPDSTGKFVDTIAFAAIAEEMYSFVHKSNGANALTSAGKPEKVSLQVRKKATSTQSASLPGKISYSRAAAPKVTIDYNNNTFKGAKDTMEYRIASKTEVDGAYIDFFAKTDWKDASTLKGSGTTYAIDFGTTFKDAAYVQFRVKAVNKKPASHICTVEIAKEIKIADMIETPTVDYAKELVEVKAKAALGSSVLQYALVANTGAAVAGTLPAKPAWKVFDTSKGFTMTSTLNAVAYANGFTMFIRTKPTNASKTDAVGVRASDTMAVTVWGRPATPVVTWDATTAALTGIASGSVTAHEWKESSESTYKAFTALTDVKIKSAAHKIQVRVVAVSANKVPASKPVTVNIPAAKKIATLSGLTYTVASGTATAVPSFAAGKLTYNVELPSTTSATAQITLAGTLTDTTAKITTNTGVTLSGGKGDATVLVTAQDGTTTKTYTVKFTTAAAATP